MTQLFVDLPPEVESKLRESLPGLRECFQKRWGRDELIELALELHLDAEAHRWMVGKLTEQLNALQDRHYSARRKGAAATNRARQREADAGAFRTEENLRQNFLRAYRSWFADPAGHPSGAQKKRPFFKWFMAHVLDRPEDDLPDFEKLFYKWSRAYDERMQAEHDAVVAILGDLPKSSPARDAYIARLTGERQAT